MVVKKVWCLDGWVDGWMDGWVGGREGAKAVLRIAYINQQEATQNLR